ncbi:MAG: type II toxin-antitoxin system HipA family toxin YjjJ [Gemmataceae bacterium]
MREVERLTEILRLRGLLRGEDIQRELGISQPVFSRLVGEAGSRVRRFGRARATRYALPREVADVGREAPVFRVDEAARPHPHGTLHFLARDECWFERQSGGGQHFAGLPPFLEDMRPQGYIGRGFPTLHPELRLPGRISDWSDDHHLLALAMHGEDCVGNLILGEESLNRFLAGPSPSYSRMDYPELARGASVVQPGSSAGGEHPKFAIRSEDRHMLVKFAAGDGAAADRWRDLLVCEHLALETLREAGIPAARSEWFDLDGIRFLEVERFDRIGRRGRRGAISLYAVNVHFLGEAFDSWSRAARRIREAPALQMSEEDAGRMVRLDAFGELIGNTDRHFGNVSFFTEEAPKLDLVLTPVYDMLPMVFAPTGANVVERPFAPGPPNALNLQVWPRMAELARSYWSRVCEAAGIGEGFRRIAGECQAAVSRLMDRYA